MFPFCPSVFADPVLVLEVVEQSEEFCDFLRQWIVLYIKKLALDMLQSGQSSD